MTSAPLPARTTGVQAVGTCGVADVDAVPNAVVGDAARLGNSGLSQCLGGALRCIVFRWVLHVRLDLGRDGEARAGGGRNGHVAMGRVEDEPVGRRTELDRPGVGVGADPATAALYRLDRVVDRNESVGRRVIDRCEVGVDDEEAVLVAEDTRPSITLVWELCDSALDQDSPVVAQFGRSATRHRRRERRPPTGRPAWLPLCWRWRRERTRSSARVRRRRQLRCAHETGGDDCHSRGGRHNETDPGPARLWPETPRHRPSPLPPAGWPAPPRH